MIGAVGRLTAARIARSSSLRISLAAWSTVALGLALIVRAGQWAHGADRSLPSVYGGLVLPVVAFVLARAAFARQSMAASTAPLVALGVSPRRAAFASITVAAIATAGVGAVLALLVAVIAHGPGDPPFVRDAAASAYAGGLGGAAYAAWLALGTTLGRRGGGRLLLLAADWGLGGSESPTSLVTPRGHLRNLLGGPPPLDISQRASAAALVALIIVCCLLACRQANRR